MSKQSEKEFNEDLDKFKTLYALKSSTDLKEIVEDKKYATAAKEAARQILDGRQTEKGHT